MGDGKPTNWDLAQALANAPRLPQDRQLFRIVLGLTQVLISVRAAVEATPDLSPESRRHLRESVDRLDAVFALMDKYSQ